MFVGGKIKLINEHVDKKLSKPLAGNGYSALTLHSRKTNEHVFIQTIYETTEETHESHYYLPGYHSCAYHNESHLGQHRHKA